MKPQSPYAATAWARIPPCVECTWRPRPPPPRCLPNPRAPLRCDAWPPLYHLFCPPMGREKVALRAGVRVQELRRVGLPFKHDAQMFWQAHTPQVHIRWPCDRRHRSALFGSHL